VVVASNQTRRSENHGDEEQVVEEIPAEQASREHVDSHHRIQGAQEPNPEEAGEWVNEPDERRAEPEDGEER
jgi:hypothetical protein